MEILPVVLVAEGLAGLAGAARWVASSEERRRARAQGLAGSWVLHAVARQLGDGVVRRPWVGPPRALGLHGRVPVEVHWLADGGVEVRCGAYAPFEVEGRPATWLSRRLGRHAPRVWGRSELLHQPVRRLIAEGFVSRLSLSGGGLLAQASLGNDADLIVRVTRRLVDLAWSVEPTAVEADLALPPPLPDASARAATRAGTLVPRGRLLRYLPDVADVPVLPLTVRRRALTSSATTPGVLETAPAETRSTHAGAHPADAAEAPLLRCPFCHDALDAARVVVLCAACDAPHHAACFEESGGCAIAGCRHHVGRGVRLALR